MMATVAGLDEVHALEGLERGLALAVGLGDASESDQGMPSLTSAPRCAGR